MGHFTREECVYANYKKENGYLTFETNDKHVLISIPVTDDISTCIEDKLNEILWKLTNKELDKMGYFDCMLKPPSCVLDARVQVDYDLNSGVQYYIAIKVNESECWHEIYFDERVLISPQDRELYNDMVSYCRRELNGRRFLIDENSDKI